MYRTVAGARPPFRWLLTHGEVLLIIISSAGLLMALAVMLEGDNQPWHERTTIGEYVYNVITGVLFVVVFMTALCLAVMAGPT